VTPAAPPPAPPDAGESRNPFRAPGFSRWWLASLFAGTGAGINSVALPLFLRDRVADEARALAIAGALVATTLPGVVLSLVGGAVADRVERRLILATTYSIAVAISLVYVALAGLDHRLHQLEGIENATESGFGVGHDRREEVGVVLAFGPLDLVCTLEGVVDTANDHWHRVGRIKRLVWIHLASQVGVTGNLPATQVDRLQAGLDLLHRLVACQGAQGIDEGLGGDEVPELFGAALGERVLDGHRSAQTDDVGGAVAANDALPSGVLCPVLFKGGGLLFSGE
jgi:hypothetical protein